MMPGLRGVLGSVADADGSEERRGCDDGRRGGVFFFAEKIELNMMLLAVVVLVRWWGRCGAWRLRDVSEIGARTSRLVRFSRAASACCLARHFATHSLPLARFWASCSVRFSFCFARLFRFISVFGLVEFGLYGGIIVCEEEDEQQKGALRLFF